MKSYPPIDKAIQNVHILAFDKLDGSNIRAEWSRKNGFYKFGTRKRLLGVDDPLLGKAQNLIREKYGEDLGRVFRELRWQKAVAFFEFHGPRSFAGWHHPEDDHSVTLFDVSGDRGLLEPRIFLKQFGKFDIARLLYDGKANSEFVTSVREGRLEGMTFEGVVCKGPHVSPGLPLMFKIKNQAWLNRLKEKCGENTHLFEELE